MRKFKALTIVGGQDFPCGGCTHSLTPIAHHHFHKRAGQTIWITTNKGVHGKNGHPQ